MRIALGMIASAFVFCALAADEHSALRPLLPPDVLFDVIRADLDGSGRQDYDVVVSRDEELTPTVWIFRKTTDGLALATKLESPRSLLGHATELSLADFDGDGKPEIVAEVLDGNHGQRRFFSIFRWSGTSIEDVTPEFDTNFTVSGGDILDIDADGRPELLITTANRDDLCCGPSYAFKYSGGQFSSAGEFDGFEMFLQPAGPPRDDERTFKLEKPGVYRLRIIDTRGNARASVKVNGIAIASRVDFHARPETLTVRPLTLFEENTLSVRMLGAKDSQLIITIERDGNETR